MKFDVITIDFPWNFKVYSKDTGRGRSAAAHYDTDSLNWNDWKTFIQYLWPLMADNCALPLWMTRPSENQAIMHVDYFWNKWIAEHTGWSKRTTELDTPLPRQRDEVVYKTELFTLAKFYSNMGKPITYDDAFVGLGYHSRANTEPCKLWVRGRMQRQDAGVRQLIKVYPNELPKTIDPHSYKPPEYRRRIERLWPGKRYLEIFSRPDSIDPIKDANWTFLGYEITGNDVRDDLARLAVMEEPHAQCCPPGPVEPVYTQLQFA